MKRSSSKQTNSFARLATLLCGVAVIYACADDGSSVDDDADSGRVERDSGGNSETDDAGNSGLDASIESDAGTEPGDDVGSASDVSGPVVPEDNWPADWAAAEQAVIDLVNLERAAGANCGGRQFAPAGPVELDVDLRDSARGHSQDMAEQNYFSHDSLDGRDFMDRIQATGYTGQGPWGENIAAGQTSAQEVVDGWMDSPGHCENIMTAEFGVIGVGLFMDDSAEYRVYWTQNFGGTH